MKFTSRIHCVAFLGLLFPAVLSAQSDSMPEVLVQPLNWSELEAPDQKFNKKDAVRYVVGKDNLTAIFEREAGGEGLNDFHFLQVNGDNALDLIFSGPNEYYKEHYTMLFIVNAERAYKRTFEAPGYLTKLQRKGSWAEVVLCKPATETQAFSFVNKYVIDLDSATHKLTAQICFLRNTEIPSPGDFSAEELREVALLRKTPELIDEPPVDFDLDGKEDALGNSIANFPSGTRLIKLAARTLNNVIWDFVLAIDSPSPLLPLSAGVKPGFTFIAGWVQDEKLK